jgi:protein-disulfide isomerase
MTSNRPNGRSTSSGSVPPTSRRSARQQRLANREANRALARAGTRGGSGGPGGGLILYTVIAVVIAAVVIGGAIYLTNNNNSKAPGQPLGTPVAPAPSVMTPASIPSNGQTLGNANAPHTIDLYEDFQCPICRDYTHDVEPQVVANYVATGKAKMVWHDLLVIDSNTGGHESLDAANAARCAADQGQFWLYHDWLYANQYSEGSGAFTLDRLKMIGQAAGIKDLATFDTCVDNGTHDADIRAETAPSGVTATPTMIIDGGTPFTPSDYATVSAALDKALGISPSPSAGASASPAASASGTAGSPAVSPSA